MTITDHSIPFRSGFVLLKKNGGETKIAVANSMEPVKAKIDNEDESERESENGQSEKENEILLNKIVEYSMKLS
jgi:hypothetical protein